MSPPLLLRDESEILTYKKNKNVKRPGIKEELLCFQMHTFSLQRAFLSIASATTHILLVAMEMPLRMASKKIIYFFPASKQGNSNKSTYL